jgi:hypothetical protein
MVLAGSECKMKCLTSKQVKVKDLQTSVELKLSQPKLK